MKKIELYVDGDLVYSRGVRAKTNNPTQPAEPIVITDGLLQVLEKLELTEDKLQAKLMCRNMLTPRQFEVMKCTALGEPAKLIGVKLGVSQFTVQTHVRDVFGLIGARRLPHAISLLGL